MKLKNISEQVLVITGATSGIGLTTARMAAAKGAKLVLIARNADALRQLTAEINAGNGGERAIFFAADVADESALRAAADAAIERFGTIDAWVNNAGVSIYGKMANVPIEDMRRLFETNFWGLVHGSLIAVEHLRKSGGALINVGSVLSDRAISIQGMYSASKFAVKGFTDALRMEIEADKLPISVTLVKPSAINTPFPEHAKNYTDKELTLPPPVFAPELVAEAILYCAANPTRDFTVGEGKLLATMGNVAPRLTDKFMEWGMAEQQLKDAPKNANRPESLYESRSDLRTRGNYEGFVLEESLYQRAKLNPIVTGAIVLGGGLALATWLNSRKRRTIDENEQSRSLELGHS